MKRDCGGYSVGVHLFPFRTEKLKPTAPMVLPEEGGRVGRRPIPYSPSSEIEGLFFSVKRLIIQCHRRLQIVTEILLRIVMAMNTKP